MIRFIEKEEVEYVETKNRYGYTIERPQLTDGTFLERINVPRSGQTVLLESSTGRFVPVRIISGEYEVNGRVSNFWHWYELNEDLSLGERKSGYGFFYLVPVQNA